MTTDEAEYREKIRDDDKVAERCARERAERSNVEKAYDDFVASLEGRVLTGQQMFYQGWLARGFHELDQLNKTD